MTRITVRSFAMIREIIGEKRTVFEFDDKEPTIENLISLLIHNYPNLKEELMDQGEVKGHFVFAVNGERINEEELNKIKLSDNDELAILPPAGGG